MKEQSGPYRQFIIGLNLSIERNTGLVPGDGRYYIVREGQVIQSFRSIKKAQERFQELVKESGYKPEVTPVKPRSPSEERLERYFDAKDEYWAESYKYRGKGGKGGRGGV